ncbi:hypothetical protein [Halomonas sp. H10-9-1]|uniref:hypothetical protein n=1 Tax=Halomonas sp. H10-9-1 TaxID=2950871 RepID=UPI0032E00024
MTIRLESLHNLDPQQLMRDIHQQLVSTYGLLSALALSADERREEADAEGAVYITPLNAGHAEAAAGYLAEEVLLALRISQLLLNTTHGNHEHPIDASGLSVLEARRLACLTGEHTALDVGEALGTLLSGVVGIIRRLTYNAEFIDALDPLVPTLIIITHRLETIDALSSAWTSILMAGPGNRRAA